VAASAEPLKLPEAEWKKRLSPAAYDVLRPRGYERAGTSPLDREKRPGVFVCAGCGLPLFTSAMKFDSGTGWPSFFTTIPGAFGTTVDRKLFMERTEYHCVRCGGTTGTSSMTGRSRPACAIAITAWRCASYPRGRRRNRPDRPRVKAGDSPPSRLAKSGIPKRRSREIPRLRRVAAIGFPIAPLLYLYMSTRRVRCAFHAL